MVHKNELLKVLIEALENEDDFLMSFEGVLIDKVRNTIGLSKDETQQIIQVLEVLIADTKRHRKIISNLIETVQKDPQDAF